MPVEGPDALDVEDHAGHLGVVAQAGKLRHQRDARPGGRGHGARARPACAQHHADRGQLVFRLHHGEGRLAVRLDAVLASRNRSTFSTSDDDGVIGYHITTVHAGKHAAQRSRGVAVDDDLARGRVHPLDTNGSLLGEVGGA